MTTSTRVLDMVNTMGFSEDYADPASGIVQYGKVLGLVEAPADEIPANSIYEYLVTLPKDPAHKHGDIFRFCKRPFGRLSFCAAGRGHHAIAAITHRAVDGSIEVGLEHQPTVW